MKLTSAFACIKIKSITEFLKCSFEFDFCMCFDKNMKE